MTETAHYSVLLKETLDILDVGMLGVDDVVVDCTLGQGGHTEAILLHSKARVLGIDADSEALIHASERLRMFSDRVTLAQANFADLSDVLISKDIQVVHRVVLDLGWNRAQLFSGRGFSFMDNSSLFMSYGVQPRSGFTAAEILNTWSEKVIADVLFGYAEERYARRIAKNIVEMRKAMTFETTERLVEAVMRSVPSAYAKGKTHPATKTFQALRIAVNDEFAVIEEGIKSAWEALGKEGRMAVISFHSSEDRIVKQMFASFVKENVGVLLTKKPITATNNELSNNPSSRSAKLRGIKKI